MRVLSSSPQGAVAYLLLIALAGAMFATASESADILFADPLTFPLATTATTIASGDYNGDGRSDLSFAGSSLEVWLVLPSGEFQMLPASTILRARAEHFAGDFDEDGNLDLLIPSGTVGLYLGDGSGAFAMASSIESGWQLSGLYVEDFDNDGHLDFLTANEGDHTVRVHTGAGDGTFASHATWIGGSEPTGLAAGDFDEDGLLDTVAANFESENLAFFLGSGSAALTLRARAQPLAHEPTAVAVADLDGDGHLDLVVNSGLSGQVLLGDGTGGFEESSVGDPRVYDDFALFDANGDGIPDLASTNPSGDEIRIFEGNGDGSFALAQTVPLSFPTTAMLATDINVDGVPDLVVCVGAAEAHIFINLSLETTR